MKKALKSFILMMFVLTVVLFATACEQSPTENVQAGQEEDMALVAQLQAEIDRLETALSQFERETDAEAFQPIAMFRSMASMPEWDEVSLFDQEDSVTITDRAFLDALRFLLIPGEQVEWGGALPYTLEPYSITLKHGEETVLIHAVSRGVIELPELLPSVYLRVATELTDLGKALLPKPDFLPEDSLESKMLNSGFLLVETDDYRYYALSESRVRGVAVAYMRADKKEIDKPDRDEGSLMVEVTFFLYGEEIVMGVYPEHIRIVDGDEARWHEVEPSVTEGIVLMLNAD